MTIVLCAVGATAVLLAAFGAGCAGSRAVAVVGPSTADVEAGLHAAEPPTDPRLAFQPGEEPRSLTVLAHEYMASSMSALWVHSAQPDWLTPSYVPPGRAHVIYVLPELVVADPADSLSGDGAIRVMHSTSPNNFGDAHIVRLRAPVRYLKVARDLFEPGYFEPAFRVFYRWRCQSRTRADVKSDPATDAISPVVDWERVTTVVDIDPPEGERRPAP